MELRPQQTAGAVAPDPAPSVGTVGYCAATEYNSGDCIAGDMGSFRWPIGQRHHHAATDEWREVGGMQDCIARCLECARCQVVSYSRTEHDCSWYFQCNLEALHTDLSFTGHNSRRVRNADGSTDSAALEFLQRSSSSAGGSFTRLVDVVVYGGPHYDEVLELRMQELSNVVDLFLIIEHARPRASQHEVGSSDSRRLQHVGRRFDSSGLRFAPFANMTRHILLDVALGLVHEFIDVDMQTHDDRERVVCASPTCTQAKHMCACIYVHTSKAHVRTYLRAHKQSTCAHVSTSASASAPTSASASPAKTGPRLCTRAHAYVHAYVTGQQHVRGLVRDGGTG